MQAYVAGFLFLEDRSRCWLIPMALDEKLEFLKESAEHKDEVGLGIFLLFFISLLLYLYGYSKIHIGV